MKHFKLGGKILLMSFALGIFQGSMQASGGNFSAEYHELKEQAEKYYEEGSYTKSHDIYQSIQKIDIPKREKRWVSFRTADTLWRLQAGSQTSDSTKYDKAHDQLQALIRDIKHEEEKDFIWAEIQESLGDYRWLRRDLKNWHQAWPHYQKALDWWAGSSEIEKARDRYIRIIKKIARPEWAEPHYYYGYYGNSLPIEILDNAKKVSKSDNDKAYINYLIAMTLRHQGDWASKKRVREAFEDSLEFGKTTDWYDDALYHYGEHLMSHGKEFMNENGQWQSKQDFVEALEIFRRFLKEFQKGESRFYDQAKQQIENITKPVVNVTVSNIFLPDSEIQYYVNWRNVKKVDFALYKVNLSKDIQFLQNQRSHQWKDSININRKEKELSWKFTTDDKGEHAPGNQMLTLDKKLAKGAYILEASSDGETGRDLVLVTEAAIILKTSAKQDLVYFSNAYDGSPIADGSVTIRERIYINGDWIWRSETKSTDKDGLAYFDLFHNDNNRREKFVCAIQGDDQAFSIGSSYGRGHKDPWRIYAFTDRPAYRPNETVRWKFIARTYDGEAYHTPSEVSVTYEIKDPHGSKIKTDEVLLNRFGSAWGELEVDEKMPLGEYRVRFWTKGRGTYIGDSVLFRLEEYKLPEFNVSVKIPEVEGKPKTFQLGDTIEAAIQANYYFGGAVSNATVEVLVYQNPFTHSWRPRHAYEWYYKDINPQWNRGYGSGQVIKRETLKTNDRGQAIIVFETPQNSNQDYEYRIEARVTDASRREIIGNGMVKVTRQNYYVYLHPDHNIYRPLDEVQINIKSLDANNNPVSISGKIEVTRDVWKEIWVDSLGKKFTGEEYRKRINSKNKSGLHHEGDPWKLVSQDYEHEKILTTTAKTDAEGEVEFTFTPERVGYYRVAWVSQDKRKMPIKAETTVWVADNQTTELGYRYGALQLIVDKDTFHVGKKAPVMISVPTSGRYVLFTVEGEELYHAELVHVTGTVKLVELDIKEKHVPNIFLAGAMVHDYQLFMDSKQIIVPAEKNFLNVDITSDKIQYQPREEGIFHIVTTDHEGNPVSAEVALGAVDESVFYIQKDYAGDPREYYFGQKRAQTIRTQSTFQQKSYVKLIKGQNDQIKDARILLGSEHYLFNKRVLGVKYMVAKNEVGGFREQKDVLLSSVMLMESIGELVQQKDGAPAQGKIDSPAVQVRSDFRSTAFWQPDIVTDKNGEADIKVKFPDSLTSWMIKGRAVTEGNQFGMGDATVRTKMPLIVRLQAPRFFVVGDEVIISANINNNTDKALAVMPSLEAEGVVIKGMDLGDGEFISNLGKSGGIQVPAQGEKRVNWLVSVEEPGNVKLTVVADGGKHTDAMEKTYIAYEHGIEKYVAKSGKVRSDDVTIQLDIPKERKQGSTSLEVHITPSMAVTMLDALPYLIDYPYGCTEQTMSRFLPAAVTAKTLKDLGVDPDVIQGRIFGGIEEKYADKTHPKGKQNLKHLDDMIHTGLERLYDFQHSDGGWGWWKKGDSDHFMTSYVVWGLTLAGDSGIHVKNRVIQKGVAYLEKEIVEEELNFDIQAWMLHALASYHASEKQNRIGKFQQQAFDNLWKNKDKLNAYTRSLFALSAHYFGKKDESLTLIRNLENGVKRDTSPDTSIIQRGKQDTHKEVIGTAHWGEDGIFWRWSDGGVEATAFGLRALLTIDPANELIEPVTNWLIKNRRGAQWSNTRDTAITILAMNDYLRESGELEQEIEYELIVNGQLIAHKKLEAGDILGAPSRFKIDPQLIKDGLNEIRIKRLNGEGSIYFAAHAKYFSLEEPITPAGNEIFVRRQYFKLVGRPTLLKGYVYEKVPLNSGETIKSGERVEVIITIEGKNNYEYLVFEDLKPAGFEAVQIKSGENLYAKELKLSGIDRKFGKAVEPDNKLSMQAAGDGVDYTGESRWVYQELRDRKVVMFIDKLPEGVWEIRYELRAEVPGQFHALPVLGHAMYVPEIRCNGGEQRVKVVD